MKQISRNYKAKTIIGWHEWCRFPKLNLPGIIAKIDTGAKTSSLHAFKIKPFKREGESWVNFDVHPLQRHRYPVINCESRVVDERAVTSSNGTTEHRIVISTSMVLGGRVFPTELTLTNRDEMGFRLLIGRKSLNRRFIVDPSLKLTLGDYEEDALYPTHPHKK